MFDQENLDILASCLNQETCPWTACHQQQHWVTTTSTGWELIFYTVFKYSLSANFLSFQVHPSHQGNIDIFTSWLNQERHWMPYCQQQHWAVTPSTAWEIISLAHFSTILCQLTLLLSLLRNLDILASCLSQEMSPWTGCRHHQHWATTASAGWECISFPLFQPFCVS